MSINLSPLIRKSHIVQFSLGLVLTVFLMSCGSNDSTSSTTWKIYKNERFGFEFPYPDRWVMSIPPENRDGIAFGDPQNPDVEIRGWAAYERSFMRDRKKQPSIPAPLNFKTLQGVPGNLDAKIGAESSSLTLTLVHEGTRYYWRGSTPNQKFADYFRFFNYIASHYRVSAK
ncbi:hypothetical protein C7B65_16140 [Phormidesmis priestleyi ULC007]|uniref:Uncharacterized protein n=1 Tax=Phormidesmis priestleyi ULC007 TaxID=1920490 RepID=A0A2T1DCR6_9CYAN|nr:hypothetical protein [Phormidesmis priestleyi]PSB18231.1 hypothetical protein C7B65_16140 [Phormidesmis priestleyi ULC007]PZO49502.1 MAG: hypothetical protein DCF14_14175 [Phormidesmis priestleyi]